MDDKLAGFKTKCDITDDVIEEALTESLGNVSKAARELGIHPSTLYRRLKCVPDIRRKLNELREARVDHVENCLMDQIEAGNTTATIFFLKCQGRHRGWVDRREQHTTVDSRKVSVNLTAEKLETEDAKTLSEIYRDLGVTGHPAQIESDADALLIFDAEPDEDGIFTVTEEGEE